MKKLKTYKIFESVEPEYNIGDARDLINEYTDKFEKLKDKLIKKLINKYQKLDKRLESIYLESEILDSYILSNDTIHIDELTISHKDFVMHTGGYAYDESNFDKEDYLLVLAEQCDRDNDDIIMSYLMRNVENFNGLLKHRTKVLAKKIVEVFIDKGLEYGGLNFFEDVQIQKILLTEYDGDLKNIVDFYNDIQIEFDDSIKEEYDHLIDANELGIF